MRSIAYLCICEGLVEKLKVKVVGAPGYEDFEADLIMRRDDWPMAVVGFTWKGEYDLAVVPSVCIQSM